MGPHGRNDDQTIRRHRLQEGVEARAPEKHDDKSWNRDLVYDFTGLHRPDLCDLSLILTARLAAAPEERVWVRALPNHTWRLLYSLGLDHLFEVFPGPSEAMH